MLAVCGIVVQMQSDTWRNPEAETKQIYTLISYINTFLDNDNVSLIASVLSLIAIPYCGYMLKNNMGYILTGIASAVSVFILIQWTRKREYLKIMLFQVFYMAGYLLVEYAVYNGMYVKRTIPCYLSVSLENIWLPGLYCIWNMRSWESGTACQWFLLPDSFPDIL